MRNVCVGRGVGTMTQSSGRAMGKVSSFFSYKAADFPLSSNLLPIIGPPITVVRDKPQFILDHEEVWRECLAGEIGFTGGRQVRNETSKNWNDWSKTEIAGGLVTIAADGLSATCETFISGDRAWLEHNISVEIGDEVLISFAQEINSGGLNGQGNITAIGAIPTLWDNVESDGRLVSSKYTATSTGSVSIRIGIGTVGSGTISCKTTIELPLVEIVNGRSDTTTPSSVVDGTEWSDRINGNTVLDNVVTEATGQLLHPGVYYIPRINSHDYVVGDKRVVGNYWYECVKAGTSAASEGSFLEEVSEGNLITNGDFESGGVDGVSLPDGWKEDGSFPDEAYKTGEDSISGNYGVKIIGNNNEGIEQKDSGKFSVVSGRKYLVRYSAKLVETTAPGTPSARMGAIDGDDTGWDNAIDLALTSEGVWLTHYEILTSAGTGDNARINFLRISNAVGDTTLLLDDVRITPVTEDGTVAWENKGPYKEVKGLHREEERINRFTKSREFDHTNWIKIGTPVLTQDQVGIDGKPNTAFSFEDNSGTSHEAIRQSESVVDDSEPTTKVIYVKKDTDETRFPEFQLYYGGGTTNPRANLQFNTTTGDYTLRSEIGTVVVKIKLIGDFWEITITVYNDGSGNINVFLDCYASVGDVWGSADVAAQGTCIIDFANLFEGKPFATNPIFTDATEVTSDATQIFFPSAGLINDAEGAIRIKWRPMYDESEADAANGQRWVISIGAGSVFLYTAADGGLKCWDGTNTTTVLTDYYADTEYDILLSWFGTTIEFTVNGVLEATGTYAGSWVDTGTFWLGSQDTTNKHDSSDVQKLQIWKRKKSQAEAASITAFNPYSLPGVVAVYENDINTITYDAEGVSQWDDQSGNGHHLVQATDNDKPFPGSLGSDIVINGDFATDTNWTKETGWSIAAGVASCDGTQTGNTSLVPIANNTVEGIVYAVTYTISNYSAGAVGLVFGSVAGILRTANGTYTEIITSGSGLLKSMLRGNSSFIGDIDNFSAKPLTIDGSINFDGIQQFLKTASFDLKQPTTVFFRGKQITWTFNTKIIDGDNGDTLLMFNLGVEGDVRFQSSGDIIGDISGFTTGNYHVLTGVYDGVNSVAQLNNDSPTLGDAGATAADGFTLASSGSVVGGQFANINAQEIWVFKEALDAGQRQKMINYLNNL